MPTQLKSLTSLRFFAALFVVIYHARVWGPAGSFVSTGYVSVGFFFVLSGFILTYNYAATRETDSARIDLRRFWSARFARVYPVFLLSLALGGLPAWAAFHHGHSTGSALLTLSWTGAVNLLLLCAFSNTSGAWNTPAWSLSAEAFFYGAFHWILGAVDRIKRSHLWIAALLLWALPLVVLLFWCHLDPEIGAWMGDVDVMPTGYAQHELWVTWIAYSPLGRWPEFAMGVVLGRIFLSRRRRVEPSNAHYLWIFSLGLCVAVLWQAAWIPNLLLNNGLLAPLFAVVIYFCAELDADKVLRSETVLSHPWLVLLGESSYALYILHVPVRDWLSIANRWLMLPRPALFVIYLGLLLPLSIGAFVWIEKPCRKWLLGKLCPS